MTVTLSATFIFSALLASPLPPAATHPPTPLPVIMWVKADGPKEIVRIAFLGFDVDHPPTAPDTLRGQLYWHGRAMSVKLHRNWQGLGATPGGWVGADYLLEVPQGATGDAVLSLGGAKDGWYFRLGEK